MAIFTGSPPHTWRILREGKFFIAESWDHLHIRGEYGQSIHELTEKGGSPPHTWRIPQV